MIIEEEGIKIKSYGEDISKKLEVFYNPVMKINRDISLLVIHSFFEKPIKFCDPMSASGIRELRFLKTIPEKFEKIVMGDASPIAIKNIKKNFKLNKIKLKKTELKTQNAINTISQEYFDFIEIDPFGSPVPFIDVALQRIKHNGILSITATDTAALCGTYPKKTLRKYNIKVEKTLWHEELGIRNLIAYCQIQGAKFDKSLTPILSMSHEHFYKIFFKVEESRNKSYEQVKNLKYLEINKKTQEIEIQDFETKNSIGKTYIGEMCDEKFIQELIKNISLIEENKKVEKLLVGLNNEINTLGYYNINKLQKEFKFSSSIKYEKLFEELTNLNFQVSRVHNNPLGIKTTAKSKDIIKIMKKYKN